MSRIFSVVLAVACMAAPLAGQKPSVLDVDWLSGCWLAESDDLVNQEVWMEPRGGLMVGMARTVRGGEARGYEFVLLRAVEDGLTFTAHPSGQTPADFRATLVTADLLRVENPAHDFPQKIEYHRVRADSLVARVYGDVAAETPAFQLLYARTAC